MDEKVDPIRDHRNSSNKKPKIIRREKLVNQRLEILVRIGVNIQFPRNINKHHHQWDLRTLLKLQ